MFDGHVAIVRPMPDVDRHSHLPKVNVPSMCEQPEISSGRLCGRGRRVAEIIEKCASHDCIVAEELGIRLSEHAGETVEGLLWMRSTHPHHRSEQEPNAGRRESRQPGQESIWRQRRIPWHEGRHSSHRGNRIDLACQEHAARKGRRSAPREAHDRASPQSQMPDELSHITGTGGDLPRRVEARPAVARTIWRDHGDSMLKGRSGEACDLARRTGGPVEKDDPQPVRISQDLVGQDTVLVQLELHSGRG